MAKTPKEGDPAPDFELSGTDGPFRLSEQRGRKVILLFYPGDDTAVCTRQFCSYAARSEDMSTLDAVVVGISAQDIDSHEAFSAKHDLNVPLLADADGAVAKAFSVWGSVVGTKRAVIIVDGDGDVQFRHDHALGLDFLNVDQLQAALENVA